MKTKSKLVLGLSILSAAAMASASTATFAWYQANANSTNWTHSRTIAAAATAQQYDVGEAVRVIADFVAVEEATIKAGTGNLPSYNEGVYAEADAYADATQFFEKRNVREVDHYVPISVADATAFATAKAAAPGAKLYKLTTNPSFGDVELTDKDGKTWAYTKGGNVDVSAQVHKDIIGVAKLRITLDNLDKSVLASLTENQVVTLTLAKEGYMKIYDAKPNGDNKYVDCGGIVFTLTIAANGTYSATTKVGNADAAAKSETSPDSGVWEIPFYYGRQGYAGDDGTATTNYANDTIKVSGVLSNRGV